MSAMCPISLGLPFVFPSSLLLSRTALSVHGPRIVVGLLNHMLPVAKVFHDVKSGRELAEQSLQAMWYETITAYVQSKGFHHRC